MPQVIFRDTKVVAVVVPASGTRKNGWQIPSHPSNRFQHLTSQLRLYLSTVSLVFDLARSRPVSSTLFKVALASLHEPIPIATCITPCLSSGDCRSEIQITRIAKPIGVSQFVHERKIFFSTKISPSTRRKEKSRDTKISSRPPPHPQHKGDRSTTTIPQQ